MMDRVKRYDAVHIRYEDNNIRYGEGCEVEMVSARDYDALHAEAEALRTELGKARGLLREASELISNGDFDTGVCCCGSSVASHGFGDGHSPVDEGGYYAGGVSERIDAFLTSAQSPEVQPEQGERQEAACWVPRACLDKLRNGRNNSPTVLTDGPAEFNDTPLYTSPQPGPDVRALVEALENCAAALAWNCFGECRAVPAGPIMPAAKALDTARAALAAHRQAQRK